MVFRFPHFLFLGIQILGIDPARGGAWSGPGEEEKVDFAPGVEKFKSKLGSVDLDGMVVGFLLYGGG